MMKWVDQELGVLDSGSKKWLSKTTYCSPTHRLRSTLSVSYTFFSGEAENEELPMESLSINREKAGP